MKPAWESIVLAMAPLDGTFAENALAHGVAGLNVDGGRVEGVAGRPASPNANYDGRMYGKGMGEHKSVEPPHPAGRWPSNLLLCHHPQCREVGTRKVKSGTAVNRRREGEKPGQVYSGGWQCETEDATYADPDGAETVTAWDCHPSCPVAGLDRQSGELHPPGTRQERPDRSPFSSGEEGKVRVACINDTGGASRFYFQASFDGADFLMYHAKAASSERRIGMPPGEVCRHPTLKPISLMAYLAKLLLPPERPDAPRRLLVPFAGAGSEIIGACRAGWEEVVGIELEPEHVEWARMRVAGDAPLFNVVTVQSEEGGTE